MFGDMLGNKDKAQSQVTELVDRLQGQAGLTEEQSKQVLETIKDFVVEKYPMLQGAVSSMFGNNNSPTGLY